jgi:hypothetical protein
MAVQYLLGDDVVDLGVSRIYSTSYLLGVQAQIVLVSA